MTNIVPEFFEFTLDTYAVYEAPGGEEKKWKIFVNMDIYTITNNSFIIYVFKPDN